MSATAAGVGVPSRGDNCAGVGSAGRRKLPPTANATMTSPASTAVNTAPFSGRSDVLRASRISASTFSGSGAGFSDLMVTGSTSIGYDCCLPAPNHGRVATTTDQDYLRLPYSTANTEALMRNIVARLAHPTLCD